MQENNKKNFSINNRIIQFIEYLNISRYRFAHETGISEVNLLNIYKGKNKPSIDLIEKILHKYEVLNPTWLLTGEGEMLRAPAEQQQGQPPPKIEVQKEAIAPPACALCAEKERVIAKQEQIIKDKDKIIALLEGQLSECKAKRGVLSIEPAAKEPAKLK
ncbi:MAG TPA: helix-turn-helix transcriptional regulator [Bacteroidales bacterium]